MKKKHPGRPDFSAELEVGLFAVLEFSSSLPFLSLEPLSGECRGYE